MPLGPVRRAALAVALFATALSASAQSALPPGVRGGPQAMATRSVSQYLELERALAAALQTHRRSAVEPMLAPDFELRSADALDAMGAAEWLAAQTRAGASEGRVRDLAVRAFGAVDVVSFWLDRRAHGKAPMATLWVVDVWNAAEHTLAARYISQPARPLPAPARPRGRE
jgi:hypothetical protein